jgi:hypothetical protein
MREVDRDAGENKKAPEKQRLFKEIDNDAGHPGKPVASGTNTGKMPKEIGRALKNDLSPQENDWRNMNSDERCAWLQKASDTVNRKLELSPLELRTRQHSDGDTQLVDQSSVIPENLLKKDAPTDCIRKLCEDSYGRYQMEQVDYYSRGWMVDDVSKASRWSEAIQKSEDHTATRDFYESEVDENNPLLRDAHDFSTDVLREVFPMKEVEYREITDRFNTYRKPENIEAWIDEQIKSTPEYKEKVDKYSREIADSRDDPQKILLLRQQIKTHLCSDVGDDLVGEVFKPYFDSMASQVRRTAPDGRDTLIDKVFYKAKEDIVLSPNFKINEGDNLSVEVKTGHTGYLIKEFEEGHIYHQILGHDGKSMVITTADFKDIPQDHEIRDTIRNKGSHVFAYLPEKGILDNTIINYVVNKSTHEGEQWR